MKKIILAVAALIVVVMTGFFLYVSMIDWNLHKDKIANQFSNVTGKKVVFSGPVSFNVFPSPYLKAQNVKIYHEEDTTLQTPLATIKELVAELSLFPLINGNFDVKKMSLLEPEMLIELLPEGKINWQSKKEIIDYDKPVEKIEVSLDSVMIEQAKLNIVSKEYGVDLKFDKLNAEVVADSIFGPYRIEGSYMNDNSPEGFALSLGQLSDSFATSLNFVIRHPKSDSYFRFDGSFFLKNSVLNGSAIVESARPSDFISSYYPHLNFDKAYEFPLALSMELNTNKTKIDVSNFVVKYGGTVGAGNVLIPLKADEFNTDDSEELERKKVEVAFNMTDLDLNPFVSLLMNFAKNQADYKNNLPYDVLFDLKAVKTIYKDQNIRDFALSFDILQDKFAVNSLTAILPGETSLSTQGNIFSKEEQLTYNFDVTANSLDFLKLSAWLGYQIPTVNNSTYRIAELSAGISGNKKLLKILPLKATLDKTNLNGEIGVILDSRPSIYADVTIDSLNFDNYAQKLPEDVAQKGFVASLKYLSSKFLFLNDYDMKINTSLGLGIYNSIPFENVDMAFSLEKGNLNLEKLHISSVRNSGVDLNGKIYGLSNDGFMFENLKYDLSTQDFYSLFVKDKVSHFIQKAKDLKKFEAKGVVTGNLDKFATKSAFKADDLDVYYTGEVQKEGQNYNLDGKIGLKSPDFIKFANRFGMAYTPDVLTMGIFRLNSQLSGNDEKFFMKDMNLLIGTNRFKGTVEYNKIEDKNNLTFDLNVNKLELDRFFYNQAGVKETGPKISLETANVADFIVKPIWDKTVIDYSPYKNYTLGGKLAVTDLSYGNGTVSDAVMVISLDNQLLKIQNFSGKYQGGELSSKLIELSMLGSTFLRGDVTLKEVEVRQNYFSGLKYGLSEGVLTMLINFDTLASSWNDAFSALSGNVAFEIKNPKVKGWDFAGISEDLSKRKVSEGLAVSVTEKLQTGETPFDTFAGKIVLEKSAFRFVDSSFSGDNLLIGLISSGSLSTWEMKSDFMAELSLEKAKYLINYSFSGPISNPSLFVDINPTSKVFDDANRKIEEEKKAAEKALRENRLFLIDKQKEKASAFLTEIETKRQQIEKRKALNKNETILLGYDKLLKTLGSQQQSLEGLLQKTADLPSMELSEELVKEVKAVNDVAEKSLSSFDKEYNSVYYQDAKGLLNSKYNEIADRFVKNRNLVVKFRDDYYQYPERMTVVGKTFVLDNDLQVDDMKLKIENTFTEMNALYDVANKDYVSLQSLNNIDEINSYTSKVNRLLTDFDEKEKEISSSVESLFDYLEALVSGYEKEYDEQAKTAEIQYKIEENKGMISSNGKTTTLVREIDEIQRSEEAALSEGVRVLDFSQNVKKSPEKVTAPIVVNREKINQILIEKQEGGILKKIDDEVSSSGGVIIKK
ncbi:MAG: AsmA family protein [Alphaproteobacteria bacterium]|nr:AsmA family protein [Alphaproteobacteria bacterium]